jgi:hypothetical protein
MKEPFEDETGVERAAEEASGVPLTPTEEQTSRRPPSDTGAHEDTTGDSTAPPEDLDPGELK